MKRIAALALLSAIWLTAWAQLRSIPPDAKRAEMRHIEAMTVELDGQRLELAPGAQIRDADNRIVLPVSLSPGAAVKYRLDGAGKIGQVWILSREEAAQANER